MTAFPAGFLSQPPAAPAGRRVPRRFAPPASDPVDRPRPFAIVRPPARGPCGGIGRRARLKIEFRKECWFDSGQGHHHTRLGVSLRILLINPNTMAAMTDLVVRVVTPLLPAGVSLRPATGRFGARYISTRTAAAIAGHAALDAYAEHGEGCDAVYLACFGDPGLFALKELAPRAGRRHGRGELPGRGRAWRRASRSSPAASAGGRCCASSSRSSGLGDSLAAVETVAPTGADDRRRSRRRRSRCWRRPAAAPPSATAQAPSFLAGAGLAGLAARVQPHLDIPVLCSVETGFAAVLAALASAR